MPGPGALRGLQKSGIFERALCDVIIARKGHIKSRIW